MKEINDGGPAFPVLDYLTPEHVANHDFGMSLRDYIACACLSVVEADSNIVNPLMQRTLRAYQLADWMLHARKLTEGEVRAELAAMPKRVAI